MRDEGDLLNPPSLTARQVIVRALVTLFAIYGLLTVALVLIDA